MARKIRTFKNPALSHLRRAFTVSSLAKEKKTADFDSLIHDSGKHGISRRKFIGDAAKTAALISVFGLYEACLSNQNKSKASQPTIAIVGAGIAGLHAGYILKGAGFTSQIYEGSPRTGGRIFTVNGMMGENLWTEMGGEFIDSNHQDMLNLVSHFNLPVLDRHAPSETALKEFAYYFKGKHFQLKDILQELHPFSTQIKNDIASLSDEISSDKHSPADQKFDNLSIMAYLDSLGVKGWFRDFINSSYTAEYGMDADEQSALSFLTLFDPGDQSDYKLYGESDERYSVINGNLRICDALVNELKEQIHAEHMLTAISQLSNKYVLTFHVSGQFYTDVEADIVLLTLPFTTLREVDIRIPLPDWKTNVIKNLGYGTNAKLFAGVNSRVWRDQGYTGYAFSDNSMTNGYDHTQMQNNNQGAGAYTIFLGGKEGLNAGGQDLNLLQKKYVPALDEIFPGVNKQFNQKFQMWHWPSYVYSKCSYMSYKVGQYTTLGGLQSRPIDNLYFAGEHCSYEFQGFMNGGAQTGRAAAEQIIAKLKS